MNSAQARKEAIRKASLQVRTGSAFLRREEIKAAAQERTAQAQPQASLHRAGA